LFGFGCGFGGFDTFLKFFFQDLIDELFPFDKEKVIEIVKSATIIGTIHDLITVGEEGIETVNEKIANRGRGGLPGGTGDYSPGALTEPSVRNYRTRLLRILFCYVILIHLNSPLKML